MPLIAKLADAIYRRIDWRWMLAGHPTLLSMGWKPESGFLDSRWDHLAWMHQHFADKVLGMADLGLTEEGTYPE